MLFWKVAEYPILGEYPSYQLIPIEKLVKKKINLIGYWGLGFIKYSEKEQVFSLLRKKFTT